MSDRSVDAHTQFAQHVHLWPSRPIRATPIGAGGRVRATSRRMPGYIGYMVRPQGTKPLGATWRPVADLPQEAEAWGVPAYRQLVAEWGEVRQRLEDRKADRSLMDIWLRERSPSVPM